MKLTIAATRIQFDATHKSVTLADDTDSSRARELLRDIAAHLVSGDSVRSGYLRLNSQSGRSTLSNGHLGSGATAATDLVKKLVQRAYGGEASRALETYLAKTGNKVGTQSLFKLVHHMEYARLGDAARAARVSGKPRLNVMRQERSGPESLGAAFHLKHDVIVIARQQLRQLEQAVDSFERRCTAYVDGQEQPATLEEGEHLLAQIDNLHKKVLFAQPKAEIDAELDMRFCSVLSKLRYQLATMIIERNELPKGPDHPDFFDEVKWKEKQVALETAHDHLVKAQDSAQQAQYWANSSLSEAIKTELAELDTQLKYARGEDVEVQVVPLSDEEADVDALRNAYEWNTGPGKTSMEPPPLLGDHPGYESVSVHLQQQAVIRKEQVSAAELGRWMSRDIKGLLSSSGWSDAKTALRALDERAEWLLGADSRDEGEQALNFLQQIKAHVQSELDDRLDTPAQLELDPGKIFQALQTSQLSKSLSKAYTEQSLTDTEYLTLRMLLMMQPPE